ncbi:MAG: IS3 family transposase [Candidatus Eisenbacteria bacterium]
MLKGQFPIRSMCRWLAVSASGYYAWRSRSLSERRQRNQQLAVEMRTIHAQVRQSYGSPRMHRELLERGFPCGRHRVARLMRSEGLWARRRKRFKVTTQGGGLRSVPDRVKRRFRADAPNRVWVSDITAVPTAEGWLYLATVLDLYSRRVVGWSMQDRLHAELVLDAVNHAAGRRSPGPGWILHSDHGVQYTSANLKTRLDRLQGHSSMGRIGNCFDNAVAESFFASLKEEWICGRIYPTRQEARRDVFEYIEMFYNPTRRHSTLGYLSPAEYERRAGAGN